MTSKLNYNGTQDPRSTPSPTSSTSTMAPWLVGEPGEVDGVSTLANLISDISENLSALRLEVSQQPRIYTIAIYDLGSQEYNLAAPLSIVVEEHEEYVTARCPELDVIGEGSTASTAIYDLKNAVLDLYDELIAADSLSLGPAPLAWLRILTKLIVKE